MKECRNYVWYPNQTKWNIHIEVHVAMQPEHTGGEVEGEMGRQ